MLGEENASLDFRLNKVNEARNYLLEETKHNELLSKKCKETCTKLNYIEHQLILASTVTGCVSISAFARYYKFCSRIKKIFNTCKN